MSGLHHWYKSSKRLSEHGICCTSTMHDLPPMQSHSSWHSHGSSCASVLVDVSVVSLRLLRHQCPSCSHRQVELFIFTAHAMSPSWRASMNSRTAVDQHVHSAVVDPRHQIHQITNTRQRRATAPPRRAQHRVWALKKHSLAIGHQHRVGQNRATKIDHFARHMSCTCIGRHLQLENTLSTRRQSVKVGCNKL